MDKFLIHVGVLKRIAFLDKINIKTNHTLDSRECRAVGKTTFSYPEEIEHIYSILNLKHGLFKEEVFCLLFSIKYKQAKNNIIQILTIKVKCFFMKFSS